MFKSIMRVAIYTDKLDEMIDYYVNKLGAKIKVFIRYKEYLDRDDRPQNQKIAKEDPERVFNAYLEIAPNQFLELFPRMEGQKDHAGFNERVGFSHYSLLVDDIFKTREELLKKGVKIDTEITKGPSETYQMWLTDPDNNRIEVMQFTDRSYQVVGKVDL